MDLRGFSVVNNKTIINQKLYLLEQCLNSSLMWLLCDLKTSIGMSSCKVKIKEKTIQTQVLHRRFYEKKKPLYLTIKNGIYRV